jgi:cell wall-associated NlpC family hydrolase
MRLRAHARTRIGAAVMAFATAVVVAPPAHAVPVRPGAEAVAVVPQRKTSKRHWARHRWFGGWHPAAVRRPSRRPSAAEIVLAKARAQLGKPYVYGSAGPNSFDCSGLTQFVWAAAGVSLPHNAAAQYGSVRRVPLKDARPGDLVFSSGLGHVGIYIGGGRMIHAPQSGRNVEVSPVRSSTLGAGRVR